jgi:hypothetical protein
MKLLKGKMAAQYRAFYFKNKGATPHWQTSAAGTSKARALTCAGKFSEGQKN